MSHTRTHTHPSSLLYPSIGCPPSFNNTDEQNQSPVPLQWWGNGTLVRVQWTEPRKTRMSPVPHGKPGSSPYHMGNNWPGDLCSDVQCVISIEIVHDWVEMEGITSCWLSNVLMVCVQLQLMWIYLLLLGTLSTFFTSIVCVRTTVLFDNWVFSWQMLFPCGKSCLKSTCNFL